MLQGDSESGNHEQQQPSGPDFTIFWRARPSAQPRSSSSSISRVSRDDVFRYRTPELQVDALLPIWSTRRYIESAPSDAPTSFVLLFGACHWKGRSDSWLTDGDLAAVLSALDGSGFSAFKAESALGFHR